jgi:hypothetical protein
MKLKHAISGLFVMLFCCVQASAQSDHTFVPVSGIDNGTCGDVNAPCRSFSFAVSNTNNRGDVVALTSGLYDDTHFTISQSITLTAAPGVRAELTSDDVEFPFITVNATTSDTVVFRNLYLSRQGDGFGVNGIQVAAVGTLYVENCVIHRFTDGIAFSLPSSAKAFIQDTIIRDSQNNRIFFTSGSGLIKASVNRCRFENTQGPGGNGIVVSSGAKVTVRDSIASGNKTSGFSVLAGDLSLENCEAFNNHDGVVVSDTNGPAVVTVSNSSATNNTGNGFSQQGGGVFHSLGNNVVRRNGTNTSGTITVINGT